MHLYSLEWDLISGVGVVGVGGDQGIQYAQLRGGEGPRCCFRGRPWHSDTVWSVVVKLPVLLCGVISLLEFPTPLK